MMRKYPKVKFTWRQWLYYKLYRRNVYRIAYFFYRHIYLPSSHACFERSSAYTDAKWARQKLRATNLCKELGMDYPYCGFYIGDGWYPTVEKALRAAHDAGWCGPLAQVKQKFCQLRIYADNASELQRYFFSKAEAECDKLCETCGQPHGLDVPMSGVALCRKCRKERP